VTRSAAFALMLVGIAIGALTLSMLEAKSTNNGLPLVHSDYALSCQPLMPIQPLKPKMHPFSRKADNA
jgi:hypothetical protein